MRFIRKIIPTLLFAIAMALAAAILTDWLPALRGPAPETDEWYWPYLLQPLQRAWPLIIGGLFYLELAALWLSDTQPSKWRPNASYLIALFITLIGLQCALVYAQRPTDSTHQPAIIGELVSRTLSPLANGYFPAAIDHSDDFNALLRNYPQAMTTFDSDHVRTHPPGLLIGNWLLNKALVRMPSLTYKLAPTVWSSQCTNLWIYEQPPSVSAAALVSAFIPLIAAAATIFPAFALLRHLFDRDIAKFGTLMLATTPGLLIFAPVTDQIYAFLALICVLTLTLGLKKQRIAWFAVSGIIFSALTFFSLGNGALLLLLLLFGLLLIWRTGWQRTYAFGILAFGLGALSIWLIFWIGWGVAPWRIIQEGLNQHFEATTRLRNYNWWLSYNLLDFLLFGGLVAILGFVAQVVRSTTRPKRRNAAVVALSLATIITLLLLDLAGSTRGETGRLWLFFMMPAALLGAGYWGRYFVGYKARLILITAQLAILVGMGVSWQVLTSEQVMPHKPQFETSVPSYDLDAQFVENNANQARIALTGYTLNNSAETIDVKLWWQTDRTPAYPYTVFVHLLNEQGELVAQKDGWSLGGQWPPTCWHPDETIPDAFTINLPDDLPSGTYTLHAGLYNAQTNQRLSTDAGIDSQPLQQISLSR